MPNMSTKFARSRVTRSRTRSSRAACIVTTGFALALLLPAILTRGLSAQTGVNSRVLQPDQPAVAETALKQIQALLDEKESRSPAQQKLDSQLLYALKARRGEGIAPGVPSLEVNSQLEMYDSVEVDITADVEGALLEDLESAGASVSGVYPQYRSVRATVPIDQLENIAARSEVQFVQPKQEAVVNGWVQETVRGAAGARRRAEFVEHTLDRSLPFAAPTGVSPAAGTKISEGDVTHKAALARSTFGFSGSGIKVGVLSDGVDSLSSSIASGDLPASVVVLSGQQGSGDEGTAILEVVHDLAPGAQLYFATAINGAAGFAGNIRALRAAGCDIILDDVGYLAETPFQDGQAPAVTSSTNGGIIMQAVNDVTASGAMYFSSAGNSGNLSDNQSGVWEGDFTDAGPTTLVSGGRLHSFGSFAYNTITASSSLIATLFWSDRLGASNNDYDLFLLNSNGTQVINSSTNVQTGTQDPVEAVGGVTAGRRLVVVKKGTAAGRFLHLSTNRGRLAINTDGQITGHACAANAFACAATPAGPAAGSSPNPIGPFPDPFSSSNKVELFSSDGPRRIFYRGDGTSITPGDVSSTGGLLRQKPDITAADGVTVTGAGGFPSRFYGTSAAAPHAGAIAALIKSANPGLTSAQIRTALVSTAIDIEAPGIDRDSGAGIVMAFEALQAIGAVPSPNFELGAVTLTEVSGNDNNRLEAGETATLTVELRNTGVVNATGVTAVLTSTTPGVTIANQVGSYPTITAPTGSATGATPFTIALNSSVACVTAIDFSLRITYAGGGSQRVIPLPLPAGPPPISITTTLDNLPPLQGAGYTATTGLQDFRVNRDAIVAACGEQKSCAGTVPPTIGPRRYDSYSFTSCSGEGPKCVTVSLTNKCTGSAFALFAVAYLVRFDPNDVCQNYFADAGVSKTNGTTSNFSFVAPAGSTFVIVVHEVGSGVAVGCDYSLSVSGLCLPCPGPAFALALRPGSQTVFQGGSSAYTLDVQSMLGFAQPVNLSATVSPSNGGVTAEVSAGSVVPGTPATITVRATTSAPIGSSYTVTVAGTAGGITRITRTTVTVTGPDYALSFNPATVTANRATRVSSILNIARLGGHTGSIDITGPDTSSIGVKVKPPTTSANENSFTFRFKVKEGATVGTHQMVFTGRDSAGRQRTGVVTLVVQ